MRIPRPRSLLAFASCAATLLGAWTFHAQLDWRTHLGCYRQGDWHFALDSIPFVGAFANEDGARIARSSSKWDDRIETYWVMTSPDSVKLRFEAGMYGRSYRFAVRGDTLAGLMFSSSDVSLPGKGRPPPAVTAVREPCPPAAAFSDPLPDSAATEALYGYAATRPTEAQLAADPWRAVAPFRAWLLAHPDAAAGWFMRINARQVFERAADSDVRTNARELVGTYRLEIERTGGPTRVFYGRTEVRPERALPPLDTLRAPEQATGYRLRFTLAADSAALPAPGPGRRHRDAYGTSFGPSNSKIDVRLPSADWADGTRRFRAYVMLVNFAGAIRGDPELRTWDYEWYRRHYQERGLNDYAEIVLWPDGRVTFTQREELAPDRVITLRGERISRDAWECVGERC